MPIDASHNRSVAAPVVRINGNLEIIENRDTSKPDDSAASTRIERALDLIREILLRDSSGLEPISGMVREALEEIEPELAELVPLQVMFQMWISP